MNWIWLKTGKWIIFWIEFDKKILLKIISELNFAEQHILGGVKGLQKWAFLTNWLVWGISLKSKGEKWGGIIYRIVWNREIGDMKENGDQKL